MKGGPRLSGRSDFTALWSPDRRQDEMEGRRWSHEYC